MCYPQLVFKILAIWKQSSIPAEQGLMFTNAIFQMCLPTFLICYLWWISKEESIFIWVAAKELGIYYSYGSGRFWPCVSNYSDLLPIGLQEAGKRCKFQNGKKSIRMQGARRGPEPPAGPGAWLLPWERRRSAGGLRAAPLARAAAGGARRGGRGVSSSRAARAGSAALSPSQRAEPSRRQPPQQLCWVSCERERRAEAGCAPRPLLPAAEPAVSSRRAAGRRGVRGKGSGPQPRGCAAPCATGVNGGEAAGSRWKWPSELPPAAAPRAGRGAPAPSAPGAVGARRAGSSGAGRRGSPCSEPCRVLGSGFLSFSPQERQPRAGAARPEAAVSGGGPARCAPRRRLPRCPSVRRRPRRGRPAAGDALRRGPERHTPLAPTAR